MPGWCHAPCGRAAVAAPPPPPPPSPHTSKQAAVPTLRPGRYQPPLRPAWPGCRLPAVAFRARGCGAAPAHPLRPRLPLPPRCRARPESRPGPRAGHRRPPATAHARRHTPSHTGVAGGCQRAVAQAEPAWGVLSVSSASRSQEVRARSMTAPLAPPYRLPPHIKSEPPPAPSPPAGPLGLGLGTCRLLRSAAARCSSHAARRCSGVRMSSRGLPLPPPPAAAAACRPPAAPASLSAAACLSSTRGGDHCLRRCGCGGWGGGGAKPPPPPPAAAPGTSPLASIGGPAAAALLRAASACHTHAHTRTARCGPPIQQRVKVCVMREKLSVRLPAYPTAVQATRPPVLWGASAGGRPQWVTARKRHA